MSRYPWVLALAMGCVGSEVSNLQAEVDSQSATIAELTSQVSDLSERLTTAETKLQDHSTTLSSLDERASDLEEGQVVQDDRLDGVEGEAGQNATDIDALTTDLGVVVARLDVAEDNLGEIVGVGDLLNYLSADTSTDSVYFSGANVYIQSGSGDTFNSSGWVPLGNLILGYDEDDGGDSKLGSHCLVLGPYQTYTGAGCFVGGADNSATGAFSSVLGGYRNSASGDGSTVYGGEYQSATITNDYAP